MITNVKYFLPLIINLSFIITGCNGSNGNDTVEDASKSVADIDSEVYSQKSWDILSPDAEEVDAVEGYSEIFSEIIGIDEYSCSNQKHSLTN